MILKSVCTVFISFLFIFSTFAQDNSTVKNTSTDTNKTATKLIGLKIDNFLEGNAYIFYPAVNDEKYSKRKEFDNMVFNSIFFEGITAIKNASIVGENNSATTLFINDGNIEFKTEVNEKYPVIILSHGFSGYAGSLSWIIPYLVAENAIVITTDHPDSYINNKMDDINPLDINFLYERPQNISALLDHLFSSSLKDYADKDKIAVIGHSLGGYTALMSAGAIFDPATLKSYCKSVKGERIACTAIYTPYIANISKSDNNKITKDYKDSRIKSLILFDPGIMRGFTKKSLKKINIPTLFLTAGVNDSLMPYNEETGYVVKVMPGKTVKQMTINDANHFSFIQTCGYSMYEYLERHDPAGAALCEPEKTERKVLHEDIASKTVQFLKNNKILK